MDFLKNILEMNEIILEERKEEESSRDKALGNLTFRPRWAMPVRPGVPR
jgi:hypothetical protein